MEWGVGGTSGFVVARDDVERFCRQRSAGPRDGRLLMTL